MMDCPSHRRPLLPLLVVLLALLLSSTQSAPLPLAHLLDYAQSQYAQIIPLFQPSHPLYPTTGTPTSPSWANSTALSGWTNGFYPGLLWLLHSHSPSPSLLSAALSASLPLTPWSLVTSTHDVGFILMQSVGLAYEATRNESLRPVLETGARSLATRFNPRVNCTRSWDSSPAPSFLVIIDNVHPTTHHLPLTPPSLPLPNPPLTSPLPLHCADDEPSPPRRWRPALP